MDPWISNCSIGLPKGKLRSSLKANPIRRLSGDVEMTVVSAVTNACWFCHLISGKGSRWTQSLAWKEV